jgi:hypothetical protein
MHTDPCAADGHSPTHVQPDSTAQVEEQPSPSTVFPSSHASDASFLPSPQATVQSQVAVSDSVGQGVPPLELDCVTVRVLDAEHVSLPAKKLHAPSADHSETSQFTGGLAWGEIEVK